jgi:hypothetical protein
MGAPRPAAHGDLCSLDSRLASDTSGKLASHARGGLPGILADLVQQSRERDADSKEMKARLRPRDAVLPDRRDIADERLQSGVVAITRAGIAPAEVPTLQGPLLRSIRVASLPNRGSRP